MIKYSGWWVEIVRYIWRTRDLPVVEPEDNAQEKQRPAYRMTAQQTVLLQKIEAVVGRDADEEDWFSTQVEEEEEEDELGQEQEEEVHVTNKQTAGRSGPNSTAHDGVKSEDGNMVMCGVELGQQSCDGDMSTATYQGDMSTATYQGDMAEAAYQGDVRGKVSGHVMVICPRRHIRMI